MSSQRPKGEGSIYQSADGRWHGSINIGVMADGKRNRRYVQGRT